MKLVISECSEAPGDVETIQDLFIANEAILNATESLTSEGFSRFLELIAPKYLEKVSAHDSWGLAQDFSEGKYDHPRYWNNPLESQLPHAPNMKLFSLYGIGKATERSYAYKRDTNNCQSIPFRIAKTLNNAATLVSSGVRMCDGDGTVPLLSSGFMGVKGWKDVCY
jgi:phospholipid:diacylglycerol acyltransferase